ncbi:chromosome partition protein Smc-like [Pseudorasbora parva]|uniref:chromosome partition protein Smc-like n=1 Tax=Pseudorasbora parva TaxID=51549 RepID=UPI00351E53C3
MQELIPIAEKTALLYHLSYLCLANFPNLERLIKSRAEETQSLFGFSDAAMMKCCLTSKNLVEDLFPNLMTAVETNKPDLAVKYLDNAREWIKDSIGDVDRIVKKYELHNKDVASSTSDVIKEKQDTDKKITEQNKELKEIEKTLDDLNSKLQKNTKKLEETENKINRKNQEIQDYTKSISQTNTGLGIFAAIVPFAGLIVKSIYDAVNNPKDTEHMKALEAELNCLNAEKSDLKHEEGQLQLQINDWQKKAAEASFNLNSIPDPIHLNEVQKSLTQIQAILVQLKIFWGYVAQMLKYLEQNTFVGEYLIEDLADLKDEFLKTIEVASEAWSSFGEGCKKASVIFKLQTKDAYRFLEVSPSSLSKEEWQKEYESVKKRLENIDPPKRLTSSGTPAIR